MKSATFLFCSAFILLFALFEPMARAADAPGAGQNKPALWIYCPTNLLVDSNIDQLQSLWTRAAKAGYSHVLLADSKFSHLEDLPKSYFANVRRVQKIAADLHMEITPSLFAIGYSNDLLFHDPNLAEGLPVKGTLFECDGSEAHVVADPPVAFGRPSFSDPSVTIENGVATVMPDRDVSRMVYKVSVAPYHCYHVSVKLKTRDVHGPPEIKVLAGPWDLNWANLGSKPTQDWTEEHIIFNSLDHKEVLIYFGIWNNPKGEMAWKDWNIEEVGLLNVLRRPGAPCVVKDDQTGKTYEEGKDYDRIVDPHMGNDPWPGEYKVWHTPPVIHTKLPAGKRLRVSWYHPVIIYDGQVAACISEPKTTQLLQDQARRMKQLWHASTYMMEYDEFRTCNWDESCQQKHQTPGQMLADHVKMCTQMLAPDRAATWNDMFDPYHNAVKGPYYLVNGPWTGSWEGLDPKVLIFNWNYGKREQSLKFFADRGNEQIIAGYYDNDLSEWKNWLDSAKKVKGVVGYLYTTWRHDYSKLEKFAEMTRQQ